MSKVIDFAYKRLLEEERQHALGAENEHDMAYWSAYLDGAIAQQKESLNEREAFLTDLLGKEPERREV